MENQQDHASINLPNRTTDYQELFENSPIALWEYDLTAVYAYFQKLRESGVSDFAAHFRDQPEDVHNFAQSIKVINVNPATVRLFEAPNKEALINNPTGPVKEGGFEFFMEGLIAMAGGKTNFKKELFNYTFTNKKLRVILHSHLIPGEANDFTRLIISITDITADYEAKKELNRKNEQLKILHSISLAILKAQSLSEIANIAVQQVPQITGCDIATIFLYDLKNNLGSFLTIKGSNQPQQTTFPLTQWELINTLRAGEHHYIEDFTQLEAQPKIYQRLAATGLRSMVNVPITVQGKLLGTLALVARNPSGFTPENIDTAKQIASALSVSFHNAKLLEIEQKARRQTETLREVALNMNSNLDLQALLEAILDQLARVVAYDAVYIVLKSNDTYEFACQRNLHPETAQILTQQIDKQANIVEIIQTQRPLLISDTATYPGWVNLQSFQPIHCWLGVPLMFKDKFIGFLSLEKTEADYYGQADINLTQAFANQAAVAIENARLYQRIQQYSAKLETRVRERTRELQVLYNVTAVAGQPLDLTTILQNTLAELDTWLNITASAIHVQISGKNKLRLACQHGLDASLTPKIDPISATDTLIGHIFTQGNAQVIETAVKHKPLLAQLKHYAGIPIYAKGNIIGVLSVFGSIVPTLKTEDMALLGTVADHIGSTIENDKLNQKARQLAALQERKRLARDLHDSVTQSLYSTTLFAEAAHDLAAAGDMVGVQKYTHEISATVRQAFKEMRLMLYELRADTILSDGLEQALQHRLETVEKRTGTQFDLAVDMPNNFPQSIQEELFRIIQEALNNSLKHADAQHVSISISHNTEGLSMFISDDGQGYELQTTQLGQGMGLIIMQERAAALGATCTFTTEPTQGTNVEVHLPLNKYTNSEIIA